MATVSGGYEYRVYTVLPDGFRMNALAPRYSTNDLDEAALAMERADCESARIEGCKIILERRPVQPWETVETIDYSRKGG